MQVGLATVPLPAARTGHFYLAQTGHFHVATTCESPIISILSTTAAREERTRAHRGTATSLSVAAVPPPVAPGVAVGRRADACTGAWAATSLVARSSSDSFTPGADRARDFRFLRRASRAISRNARGRSYATV